MKLREVAKLVGGRPIGDSDRKITGISQVDVVRPDEVTFVADAKYLSLLAGKDPAAVLVKEEMAELTCPQIVVSDPYMSAIQLAGEFFPQRKTEPGIHPQAVVTAGAKIDPTATVMALAYVGEGAVVGARTVLMPQAYVGPDAKIGAHCVLHPGAKVGERCVLGDKVILHHNVSIGADGFGYMPIGDKHFQIPQRGIVVIEDEVEIGAGSCVDRATFGRTVIGAGTKMDNLVQIAHNCVIGKNCLVVAQTGLAGSVVVGDDTILAARSSAIPHARIGNKCIVGAQGGVAKNLPDGSIVAGAPAKNHMAWKRELVALERLPQALRDLHRLTQRVEKLEQE